LKYPTRAALHPRKFAIKDLAEKARIWYNPNINGNPELDFGIEVIKYPLTTKKNPEPGITLYYRGGRLKVPVDVYTTLISVSVEPKASGEILFDPTAHRDNDVDNGSGQPAGLAAMLNVKALYSAYNNAGSQKSVDLIYPFGEDPIPKGYGTGPTWQYGPYYLFVDKDDTSYTAGLTKWSTAKKSVTQSITVRHTMNSADVGDYFVDKEFVAAAPTFGVKSPQSKTAKQSVTWVK